MIKELGDPTLCDLPNAASVPHVVGAEEDLASGPVGYDVDDVEGGVQHDVLQGLLAGRGSH